MQLLALDLCQIDENLRLEIKNVSTLPVHIWSTRFSLGYFSLHLVVLQPGGTPCAIRRRPARWTVNIPEYVSIEAAGVHAETLNPHDGTWDVAACRLDPRNEVEVSAVLDIVRDDDTIRYDVITGRFESNKLRVHAGAIVEQG